MYRAELLVKIPSDGFRTNMGLVLLTMLKSPYNPPTDHYHKSVHIVREIEKEGERERERERKILRKEMELCTRQALVTGHKQHFINFIITTHGTTNKHFLGKKYMVREKLKQFVFYQK